MSTTFGPKLLACKLRPPSSLTTNGAAAEPLPCSAYNLLGLAGSMIILCVVVVDATDFIGSPARHTAFGPDWAFFVSQGTAPASTVTTVFESDAATERSSTSLSSGGPNTGQVF